MEPDLEELSRVVLEAADFKTLYHDEFASQVRRATLLVVSSEAANDIVQDTFVRLYQRWDSVVDPGPYLNRSVLNGCRDYGRRKTRDRAGDRRAPELPPRLGWTMDPTRSRQDAKGIAMIDLETELAQMLNDQAADVDVHPDLESILQGTRLIGNPPPDSGLTPGVVALVGVADEGEWTSVSRISVSAESLDTYPGQGGENVTIGTISAIRHDDGVRVSDYLWGQDGMTVTVSTNLADPAGLLLAVRASSDGDGT